MLFLQPDLPGMRKRRWHQRLTAEGLILIVICGALVVGLALKFAIGR